jgi:RNA polymerase sigma factor (sigma-70 family)
MKYLPDDVLIKLMKEEQNESFALLYNYYFSSVAGYITKNSGSQDDAKDIFQETVIVLLQKIRQPDFVLTSALKTYLYSIAKNLWLKRLRNNKYVAVDDITTSSQETEELSIDFIPERTAEEKVTDWIKKITLNCQQILRAIFIDQESMASVMERMNWKNKHVAANQQYKCIQQVKKEKEKEK